MKTSLCFQWHPLGVKGQALPLPPPAKTLKATEDGTLVEKAVRGIGRNGNPTNNKLTESVSLDKQDGGLWARGAV